jgi:hypothetical protein
MQNVTVKKEELIKILKDNRAKHEQNYNDAVVGFYVSAEESLQTALARLAADKSAGKLNAVQVFEAVPENHLKEYDRAIRMMTMDTRGEIPLTVGEFSEYVDDEWHWTRNWAESNSKYSVLGGTVRAAAAGRPNR